MSARPPSKKIEILLHPDLEAFVAEKARAGQSRGPDELVCELLRVLRDHEEAPMPTTPDERAETRRQIAVGVEQLDNGQGCELDDPSLKAFFADVAERGRSRMEPKRPAE